MRITEVERGLHTCQECKVDARWRVGGSMYLCNSHYKKYLQKNNLVAIGDELFSVMSVPAM